MRIFTALFFIKTDYVTTLFDPYFLDFERVRAAASKSDKTNDFKIGW